ncbi:MAG: hypothetical protein M1374_04290 [Firmicutes bacterium]|nr:hypothetical protein [Bacillota bacterium]
MSDCALLIPVKSFQLAKQRLSGYFDSRQRLCLSLALTQRVVLSTKELTTFVVCDDITVKDWATSLDVAAITQDHGGLCGQIFAAIKEVYKMGYKEAIIVHSDLPKIKDLSGYSRENGIVIIPDRRGFGTNLLKVPTDTLFEFHYGENSLSCHIKEAMRHKIDYRVFLDPDLAFDIDLPEDLSFLGLDEVNKLLLEGKTIAQDMGILGE